MASPHRQQVSNLLFFLMAFSVNLRLSRSDAMDDVTAMIGQFETITSSTADVLNHVHHLGTGSMTFLKLALPVGKLVAGNLRIAGKPESEEYRALVKLNQTMFRQFDRISNVIGYATSEIKLSQKLDNYENNVHVPMKVFDDFMAKFWNPAVDKSKKHVKKFTDACYWSSQNLVQILHYIEVHTRDNCRLSPLEYENMQEDARMMARVDRLIHQIGLSAKIRQKGQNLEMERADLVSLLLYSDRYEFWSRIDKIGKHFMNGTAVFSASNTTADVIRTVKQYLIEKHGLVMPTDLRCLLDEIINGMRFHSRPIIQLANIIRMDLSRLVDYCAMCSNLTFSGDPTEMEAYEERILNGVKSVSAHIPAYINKKLETSWPDCEIQQAEEAINKMGLPMIVPEDKKQLNDIAQNLSTTMSLIGNPKYTKQLVITSSQRTINDNYYAICPEEWCLPITNYSSLNILVTRFITDQNERMFTAYKWLNPLVTNIQKIIDQNFNIGDLRELRKKIESSLEIKLVNNDYFRTLAIVRLYTGHFSKCLVAYGEAKFKGENLTAIDHVMYHYQGGVFHDCEDYVLFFIL